MDKLIVSCFFAVVMACVLNADGAQGTNSVVQDIAVESALDIAEVPSGFPVGFCLLTEGKRQYVAYYDAGHNMTVASRTTDSDKWQYQVLPSKIGWDSHNYITMALDDDGYLHLSGNMHVVPLVYFRTAKPGDITSFERIASMTGSNEKKCTYPQFMRGADRRLIFHYRDGKSGNGNELYNVYDCRTKTWKRLIDTPLTDGLGRMNAYMEGPAQGSDGWFHLGWVWRNSPDCKSNHDPSYARSRDLVRWETIDGRPIALPLTIKNKDTLIDPVPAGGGIINGALDIGFDSEKRLLVSYFKFDSAGKTQAYVARFEDGKWVPHQITRWEYRWDFKGGGTIVGEIGLAKIRTHGEGKLALPYSHKKYGGGLLVLDEQTLELVGTESASPQYPDELRKPGSTFAGIKVRWANDSGTTDNPSRSYVLRWETLPPNRDREPEGPLPKSSMLRLYTLIQK